MGKRVDEFKAGDHLEVPRHGGVYRHHGIYAGDGWVIHYTGDALNKRQASIRKTQMRTFKQGQSIHDVRVVRYGKADSAKVTLERAVSRLGEDGYSLFGNNCEHFAFWCRTGRHHSEQVKDRKTVASGGVAAGAATAAGIGVVAGKGAVAGLSGSGIMSGLAAVGCKVGGGAVAGVAALGAAPGFAASAAMHHVLRDDDAHTSEERGARSVGRKASVAGAAAGTIGTVASISAAGTTAGLSGAGITSGLAAIGTTVGGGMAAGTAVAVAAPAVAASAAGYGAYRVWKWLSE